MSGNLMDPHPKCFHSQTGLLESKSSYAKPEAIYCDKPEEFVPNKVLNNNIIDHSAKKAT